MNTSDHKNHDAEIKAARDAGMSVKDIAFVLGVHRWIVDDACKRLNLFKRNEFIETPIKYNERPLVQKTCPVCRKRHLSDPAIWTCAGCKEVQERENIAGCGPWY